MDPLQKLTKFNDGTGTSCTVMVNVPGLLSLIKAARRNQTHRSGSGPFLIQIDNAVIDKAGKKRSEPECEDCRKARAAAYSDATTPGFMYDRCIKHHTEQLADAAAKAEQAQLRQCLSNIRQGFLNILEVRKLPNGRYGDLTRDEIDGIIHQIDEATGVI